MVTEPKEFFDYLYSPEFEVSDARLVNDETVEVHYRNVGEFAEQNDSEHCYCRLYYCLCSFEIIRSARPFTRTGPLLRHGFRDLRARTR